MTLIKNPYNKYPSIKTPFGPVYVKNGVYLLHTRKSCKKTRTKVNQELLAYILDLNKNIPKECSQCKEQKDRKLFHVNRYNSDGLSDICYKCKQEKYCKNSKERNQKQINENTPKKEIRTVKRKRTSTLKKYILKRDMFKCQLCGTNNNLQCHHIIPHSILPELTDHMKNMITLCHNCHYHIAHPNNHTRLFDKELAVKFLYMTGLAQDILQKVNSQ